MKGHLFSGIWGESITFWGFKKQGAEEKHFRELGRKFIFLSGSREQRPPPWGRASQTLRRKTCPCMQYTEIFKIVFFFLFFLFILKTLIVSTH